MIKFMRTDMCTDFKQNRWSELLGTLWCSCVWLGGHAQVRGQTMNVEGGGDKCMSMSAGIEHEWGSGEQCLGEHTFGVATSVQDNKIATHCASPTS